jgi:hypothetical protein
MRTYKNLLNLQKLKEYGLMCTEIVGVSLGKDRILSEMHNEYLNMAIIIDQYGPMFMIYHNMRDGCMYVHTDRHMSGRTDEITCVTLYYPITLE